MVDKLERVDLVFPKKVKGFLGHYYPPPEPVPHFINNSFEEIYSVKRVHVIVNPFAWKKKGRDLASLIVAELDQSRINSLVHFTEHVNHAEELVSKLEFVEGDALMSVGGDGTISEIITGLLKRNDSYSDNIPLSIVPAGSGNSQANDMQITDYLEALQRLTSGKLQKMDVGKVTFFKDGKEMVQW